MKTKIAVGGLVAVLVLVAAAWVGSAGLHRLRPPASSNGTLETASVKIAYLPIVQGLPLYLALEKGYFKDAGITVQAVRFDDPSQVLNALVSGQVDFAIDAATGITGIAEAKSPGHLRIFMLTGGNDIVSNDSILVKNGSPLTSLPDLKGKKLGILPGAQWRTVAEAVLAQNNLAAGSDITLVELAPGLQAQALASGQIDALLGVEPTPTVVKAGGIGKEIVSVPTAKYIADPFYGGAGVVNFLFAQKNPKTVTATLSVLGRAVNEINKSPTDARQYLKTYTPLSDVQITQVPISLFKMYQEFAPSDVAAVQKFYDIFSAYHVVSTPLDFKSLEYSSQ